MSEELESTQPNLPSDPDGTKKIKPYKVDDTQPRQPIETENQTPAVEEPKTTPPAPKRSRWKSILTGLLGFILLLGLGGFGGYSSGVNARVQAEDAILIQQLSEQFSFALVDIQFGRYENARQRLEYIIQKDPNFPGAQEKLTEVLVLSNVPTPTAAPTATATPDFSGAENAYLRAQELIRAQDWTNALTALDTIRKMDPNYKAAQVDGMYYFALRNKGYDLITKEGNLEGGIYFLTLAERFGPLDNTARGLRDGARAYMVGASFWELDWEQASNNFEQVSTGWPTMWDGTMTAAQRYVYAASRFAEELFNEQEFCGAYDQYTKAASVGLLDEASLGRQNQAYANCFPAEPAPVESATEAPVETPTTTP